MRPPFAALALALAAACGPAAAPPPAEPAPAEPGPAEPAPPPPGPRAAIHPGDPPGPFALVVSFYSPGDGTDGDAIAALDRLIADQGGRDLGLIRARWGREGEVDYCFGLHGLDDAARADFLDRVQAALASSRKVNLYRDAACRQ
jgi:hypothetical protein